MVNYGHYFGKFDYKNTRYLQEISHLAGVIYWQGQKDLNPQPMDLESTTLPVELYPYARDTL